MTKEETLFEQNKDDLRQCCSSTVSNKIQAFSLFEDGFRIYCQSCCACADGITMQEAIDNYKSNNYKYAPQ